MYMFDKRVEFPFLFFLLSFSFFFYFYYNNNNTLLFSSLLFYLIVRWLLINFLNSHTDITRINTPIVPRRTVILTSSLSLILKQRRQYAQPSSITADAAAKKILVFSSTGPPSQPSKIVQEKVHMGRACRS